MVHKRKTATNTHPFVFVSCASTTTTANMRMMKEGSPVSAYSLILLVASAAAAVFLLNHHTPEYQQAPSHRRLNVLDPKTVMLKDPLQLQGQGQVDHPLCQLLPQVPDDLSWIPVPMNERGPRCSSHAEGINLKRCCVGQCRKSNTIITSDEPAYEGLFLKPDMPDLVSMPSMLEHLHVFVQQQNLERINSNPRYGRAHPIDTCVLWYIGQSLTQDQASAAICKLTSLGYEIPNKKKCDIGDQDGLLSGTCELTSQSNQYCPKIRVRHTWHEIWQRKRALILDEAGPIIYNYGVHANSLEEFDEWMEKKFTDDDFQAIDQVGRYPFMWREHEPQHFATKDGSYGGQASKCQDSGAYNNYRNEAALRFFERKGLLGKISFIKSFNALRPLSGFHLGFGDCTHYCYSPWRFDLTWHGIALALQTLPEQQNACVQLHNVNVDAQLHIQYGK